jgi:hypothetical protein
VAAEEAGPECPGVEEEDSCRGVEDAAADSAIGDPEDRVSGAEVNFHKAALTLAAFSAQNCV